MFDNKEETIEQARIEARIEVTQEVICTYLNARFSVESEQLQLQYIARTINNLDVLIQIRNQLFVVDRLDDAKAIIQKYCRTEIINSGSNEMKIETYIKCAIETINELVKHVLQHETISQGSANFLLKNFEQELRERISKK